MTIKHYTPKLFHNYLGFLCLDIHHLVKIYSNTTMRSSLLDTHASTGQNFRLICFNQLHNYYRSSFSICGLANLRQSSQIHQGRNFVAEIGGTIREFQVAWCPN